VATMVEAMSLRWRHARAGSARLGESGRGEEEDAAMRRWRCCHVVGGRCYLLSTLVLVFRYMFRSIVISSNSSKQSAQFHRAIRKCKSRRNVLFLERENTL